MVLSYSERNLQHFPNHVCLLPLVEPAPGAAVTGCSKAPSCPTDPVLSMRTEKLVVVSLGRENDTARTCSSHPIDSFFLANRFWGGRLNTDALA